MKQSAKNFLIIVMAMIATVMLFQGRASAAEYVVPEGTTYWESSWSGGTGKHAMVSPENAYTADDIQEEGLSVKIDGYSILNKDGSIIESHFNNGTALEEVPPIHSGNRMMLHIWSEKGYRLGWIDAQAIKTKSATPIKEVPDINEEEWLASVEPKDEDEIVRGLQESLKADESIPREAYVLGDVSGSMWEYHEEVLKRLEGYYGQKFLFAINMQEFCPGKNLNEYDIDQGGTDIVGVLNELSDVESNAHIYILSDLQDNMGNVFEKNDNFSGEITIIVYKTDDLYTPYRFLQSLKEAFPNATLTGF